MVLPKNLLKSEIAMWKLYLDKQREFAQLHMANKMKGFDVDEDRGFFDAVLFCVTSMSEILSGEIILFESMKTLHEMWFNTVGSKARTALFNPPREAKDRNYLLGFTKELRRQTDILDLWVWTRAKEIDLVQATFTENTP